MKKGNGLFKFVVQKHAATRLHYDFRLEIGGLMPSWAIPKGPTLDNTVKRLAMRTPDHDLEWRNFEGVIAEGEVGAGPVMIWDEGLFDPEIEIGPASAKAPARRREIFDRKEGERVLEEGLKKGELKFVLYGLRLKGSFALVKTRMFGGSKRESWLFIKHKDEFVKEGYDAKEFDFSARSKKKFEEIAEKRKA